MHGEITLTLPEGLLKQARRFASATRRDTATVLADALEMMWPTLGDMLTPDFPALTDLPDAAVLTLADMKMDAVQNQRLGQLQAKGKATELSEAERYELLALLQIYQRGQLRKSEAMAEAVRRCLRPPLPA